VFSDSLVPNRCEPISAATECDFSQADQFMSNAASETHLVDRVPPGVSTSVDMDVTLCINDDTDIRRTTGEDVNNDDRTAPELNDVIRQSEILKSVSYLAKKERKKESKRERELLLVT